MIEGRVAQVAAIYHGPAPLSGPQALIFRPGGTHLQQLVNIAENLNGLYSSI